MIQARAIDLPLVNNRNGGGSQARRILARDFSLIRANEPAQSFHWFAFNTA